MPRFSHDLNLIRRRKFLLKSFFVSVCYISTWMTYRLSEKKCLSFGGIDKQSFRTGEIPAGGLSENKKYLACELSESKKGMFWAE